MNRGGDGRPLFVEAPAAELGDLATPAVGRALAAGDLDGDGDDDLVLVDLAGKARILRNDQATGHGWIAVDGPLGTEVEIVTTTAAGPLAQRRAITSTRSYLSQCEPVARFGLGAAKAADAVRARFPDGSTREWTNIAANRRFSLLKPE
jgi:enediyne biosynthesis protein E4